MRLPESAVLLDPAGGFFHGLRFQSAAVHAAVDIAAKKPGGFENAQVFGNGRKRNAERFGEFRDCGFSGGQAREDGAAGGIGERAERRIKLVRIVNHLV